MDKEKPDLIYGTLDMLILKSLQHDPRQALEIAHRCGNNTLTAPAVTQSWGKWQTPVARCDGNYGEGES